MNKLFRQIILWMLVSVGFILMVNSFFYIFDPHFIIRILLIVVLSAIGNYLIFYDYFLGMSPKKKVGFGGLLFFGNFVIFALVILVSLYFPIFSYDIAEAEKEKSNPACENRIRMAESRAYERACRQAEEGIRNNQVPAAQEKQPGRTYPITDGETYRILAGRKYTCEDTFWADSRYVEILEVKLGKSWGEVFRTKDEGDGNCSQGLVIGDDSINISPLKDYIRFTLYGWEWSVPMMLNVKTKQNIFEPYTHSGPIIWSKSARNYAFISYSEQMGGTGKDGIWVSSFDNPDKPELIFNLQNWAGKDVIAWMEYALVNLKFVDNQTIEFSVVRSNGGEPTDEELAHYSYDLKRQKLTETFRK